MAKIVFIIIGLVCIGLLYFFPVPVKPIPIVVPGLMSNLADSQAAISGSGSVSGNGVVTLSQLASLCSNPYYNCQVYTGFFYIGWIIGLVLIVYGLIPKKESPIRSLLKKLP
jgi:hypothetical protein